MDDGEDGDGSNKKMRASIEEEDIEEDVDDLFDEMQNSGQMGI